jgi:drug/metabolite transporter (DMT)-like permease
VVRKIPKRHFLKLFLLSLFAAWNVILFAFGIQWTSPTSSAIIYVLSPIMALLLGCIFLKHKFSALNILWIVLGFLWTVAIILLPIFYWWAYSTWWLIGNLLIVLAMISFTIYTVWSKSLQKLFSHEAITAWFLFVTLIITGIVSCIHPYHFVSEITQLSTYAWWAIIFVGIAWTGIQYLLQQIVIKKNSYIDGSLFLYIQPIATVLLAIPLLHEKITTLFIIGAVVTLVGVWLSSRKV